MIRIKYVKLKELHDETGSIRDITVNFNVSEFHWDHGIDECYYITLVKKKISGHNFIGTSAINIL